MAPGHQAGLRTYLQSLSTDMGNWLVEQQQEACLSQSAIVKLLRSGKVRGPRLLGKADSPCPGPSTARVPGDPSSGCPSPSVPALYLCIHALTQAVSRANPVIQERAVVMTANFSTIVWKEASHKAGGCLWGVSVPPSEAKVHGATSLQRLSLCPRVMRPPDARRPGQGCG